MCLEDSLDIVDTYLTYLVSFEAFLYYSMDSRKLRCNVKDARPGTRFARDCDQDAQLLQHFACLFDLETFSYGDLAGLDTLLGAPITQVFSAPKPAGRVGHDRWDRRSPK